MDRAMLKQEAKDAMRAANPHPAVVTLAFLGIAAVTVIILQLVSHLGLLGAALAGVCGIVVDVALIGVSYGYYVYVWKVYHREQAGVEELFSHMDMLLKMLGLSLWMGLFVYLWSLLFVIPGIIAGIRYSQAIFVLVEHPEMGIRECVNESKRMMQGHVGEYFILSLSFILWALLTSVTAGIAGIYVVPYMLITFAGYYEKLKGSVYGMS